MFKMATKDLDSFCGGLTSARKPAVYNPDGERPQPDYGDEWANKTFNQKGPNIDQIRDTTHR
jgi:hypothetical protein